MKPFYNFVDWRYLANYLPTSLNLIQVCGFMKGKTLLFVGTAHLQGKTSDLSIILATAYMLSSKATCDIFIWGGSMAERLGRRLEIRSSRFQVPLWLLSCYINSMTVLSMSSRSSVDRAPARYSGGHGFDSCLALRFSPALVSCWSIHLPHYITDLEIHHLYFTYH